MMIRFSEVYPVFHPSTKRLLPEVINYEKAKTMLSVYAARPTLNPSLSDFNACTDLIPVDYAFNSNVGMKDLFSLQVKSPVYVQNNQSLRPRKGLINF